MFPMVRISLYNVCKWSSFFLFWDSEPDGLFFSLTSTVYTSEFSLTAQSTVENHLQTFSIFPSFHLLLLIAYLLHPVEDYTKFLVMSISISVPFHKYSSKLVNCRRSAF